MLIFFILLLLLPLLTIKKRTKEDGEVFDPVSTTCLKGVICLFVMFHNLGLDYKGNSEIMQLICEHSGGVGVGLFFFLSAFGIIRSYQKKGNKYLLKLIFVNIPRLYLISVGINLLTYFVFFKGQFEQTDLFLRIFNLDVFNNFNRMNRHGWYIPTIIGMYLIFALIFFIFSKFKTKYRFIIAGGILAFIAIAFRVGTHIGDAGGTYTREMPAFAIGVMYALFYDKINLFFKKFFWPSLIISFVVMWVGFFVFEPLATYASALLIIVISQRVSYKNNITLFLGKICLHIYLLLHFSSLVLQDYLTHEYLWMILNAGLIIGLSVMVYLVELIIKKVINLLFKEEKLQQT